MILRRVKFPTTLNYYNVLVASETIAVAVTATVEAASETLPNNLPPRNVPLVAGKKKSK